MESTLKRGNDEREAGRAMQRMTSSGLLDTGDHLANVRSGFPFSTMYVAIEHSGLKEGAIDDQLTAAVEKEYKFDGPKGTPSLLDLFEGQPRQPNEGEQR